MFEFVNYTDCSREQLLEILELRNLDSIRKWMVNPGVISREDHFRFVESLRTNPDRLYFAVYKDSELVGTYNLTNEGGGVWERGIFANPAFQGRGLTGKWERQMISGLSGRGIEALSAKVREDNLRSVRYHLRLGFEEVSRDGEYIHYLLKLR